MVQKPIAEGGQISRGYNPGQKNGLPIHLTLRGHYMSDEINTSGSFCQDDEEEDESIISLTDDEGRTSDYQILDAIDTQEGKFVALLPLASINDDTGEAEYIILQVVIEDNEEELAEIDDDELLMALDDLFRERFKEIYGFGDDDYVPPEN